VPSATQPVKAAGLLAPARLRHRVFNGFFNRALHYAAGTVGPAAERPGSVTRMAVNLAMKVLVVDDYPVMVRIVRALLSQIGFTNVEDAADGETAFKQIKENRYGLVISDLHMDPVSGHELLKRVRAEADVSRTPFLMITADSKAENVIAAKKAGVDSYVTKPFNAAMLKEKIENIFGE
jgi:two-component system chemotaxis response regulator CheY